MNTPKIGFLENIEFITNEATRIKISTIVNMNNK